MAGKSLFGKCMTLMSSTMGLLLLNITYLFLGAWLFLEIEAPREESLKNNLEEERNTLVDLIIDYGKGPEEFYRGNASDKLAKYEESLANFYRKRATFQISAGNESLADKKLWTPYGAIIFCYSVITTIGWGNIVPATTNGRLGTVIYGLNGMPLFFSLSSDVGLICSNIVMGIYIYIRYSLIPFCRGKKPFQFPGKQKKEEEEEEVEDEGEEAADESKNRVDNISSSNIKFLLDTSTISGLDSDPASRRHRRTVFQTRQDSTYLSNVGSCVDFLLYASSELRQGRTPRDLPHFRIRNKQDAMLLCQQFTRMSPDELAACRDYVGFDNSKEIFGRNDTSTVNWATYDDYPNTMPKLTTRPREHIVDVFPSKDFLKEHRCTPRVTHNHDTHSVSCNEGNHNWKSRAIPNVPLGLVDINKVDSNKQKLKHKTGSRRACQASRSRSPPNHNLHALDSNASTKYFDKAQNSSCKDLNINRTLEPETDVASKTTSYRSKLVANDVHVRDNLNYQTLAGNNRNKNSGHLLPRDKKLGRLQPDRFVGEWMCSKTPRATKTKLYRQREYYAPTTSNANTLSINEIVTEIGRERRRHNKIRHFLRENSCARRLSSQTSVASPVFNDRTQKLRESPPQNRGNTVGVREWTHQGRWQGGTTKICGGEIDKFLYVMDGLSVREHPGQFNTTKIRYAQGSEFCFNNDGSPDCHVTPELRTVDGDTSSPPADKSRNVLPESVQKQKRPTLTARRKRSLQTVANSQESCLTYCGAVVHDSNSSKQVSHLKPGLVDMEVLQQQASHMKPGQVDMEVLQQNYNTNGDEEEMCTIYSSGYDRLPDEDEFISGRGFGSAWKTEPEPEPIRQKTSFVIHKEQPQVPVASLGVLFGADDRRLGSALDRFRMPLYLMYLILLLYVLFGSLVCYIWENNLGLLDSVYFIYVLLSTTGFGDLLPSPHMYTFIVIYATLGMALYNIMINATLELFLEVLEYLGSIGETSEPEEEEEAEEADEPTDIPDEESELNPEGVENPEAT